MADLTIGKTNVTKLLSQKYKLLGAGWISLVTVPSESHMEVNKEAIRVVVNDLKYTCIYITLGKSCTELGKIFKTSRINMSNVFFIDAISKMYGESTTDTKQCAYVSGPLDIDAITSTMRSSFEKFHGERICVFLDSVTTVLLYNSLNRTLRFSKFLTQTLKEIGINGIMVSIAKGDTTKKLIVELSKLCDEVINIE